jgi:hypothetical protein
MAGKLLILKFIIMKKKIIIASASVLFAVATVFNMNLLQGNSAGDVSVDAIAIMAQAQVEYVFPEVTVYGNSNTSSSAMERAIHVFYFNGQRWTDEPQWYNDTPFTTRWKPHKEPCSGFPKQNTNKTSLNMGFSIGIPIPGFPLELRSNYGYTSEQTTYYDEYQEYRVICVDGDGNCFNGTPCKRG